MSVVTSYPFDNTANYTKVNTEVTGGIGQLIFVPNPGQVFAEDFTDDTGFTYDNTLAEFTGGLVRQKDRTPTASLLSSRFSEDAVTITDEADADWSKVSIPLGATKIGSPSISGGKLVCTGNQGIYYSSVAVQPSETHKIKYTPNYSTSPPANVNIIGRDNGTNNNNKWFLTNSPSGNNIRFTLFNATGGVVISTATTIAGWNPTAGQTYEFAVVLNSSAGTVRVFIDGILIGTLSPGPWTRSGSGDRVYIGSQPSYSRAEGSFDDYIYFNTPLYTTNYTPGYTLVPTIYGESKVDGPNFTYTGLGTVLSVDDGSVTESGTPRYIVGGQYWNGSAWVISDGTYAQANSFATALANFPSFDAGGGGILPWAVVFGDSNTQSSVDEFDIEVTGQKYASEGTLLTNNQFVAREIVNFVTTVSAPTGTSVKFSLNIGGTNMYHDGSSWVESDGTSSQANTSAEILANISTALTVNSAIKILVFLISDGTATPQIDLISVTYNFGALEPPPPNQCQVYGFLKDGEDLPIANATITARPNREVDEYVEAADRIIGKAVTVTTDANGFFSMNLIASQDYEVEGAQPMRYLLTIVIESTTIQYNSVDANASRKSILFEVPNQASVNITEQIGAA